MDLFKWGRKPVPLSTTEEEVREERAIITPENALEEVGKTGLAQWSGDVRETEVAGLRSLTSRVRTFKEMSQEDPTIGGFLQTFINICLSCTWQVEEASIPFREDDPAYPKAKEKAEADAEFLREVIGDMNNPFEDAVADALQKLPYGFSILVPQFKIRAGYSEDRRFNSKYDDKKFGWRVFKPLAPDSIWEWITEEDGQGYDGLMAIKQQTITGQKCIVPRDRMMLFRTTSKLDNPEGESLLLTSVSTYKSKKKLLNIEEVGLERNLEGIPVMTLPSEYMKATASTDKKQFVAYAKSIVSNLKFNKQTGIILPSDKDSTGNRIVDLTLLSPSGTSRPDAVRTAISARELLIAESVMAQFMKLVNEGSNALSEDQTEMFVKALKGYMDRIREVFNSEAVDKLFKLNGDTSNNYPRLVYTGLEKKNVANIVNAMTQAVATGAVIPTKATQTKLLEILGMPTTGSDEAWDKVTELQTKLSEQLDTPTEAGDTGTEAPDEPEVV